MKIELELDEYIEKLTKAYKDGFNDGYNMKSINYTPVTTPVTYKESWKPEPTYKDSWKPEWVYRPELQPTYYSDKVTYDSCNATCANPGEVK